jgi:hypothetical protein
MKLRDMESPTVLGYVLDRKTLTPSRPPSVFSFAPGVVPPCEPRRH